MKRVSSKTKENSRNLYLDGGWGWVVMIASFLSQTLIGSVYFGYGVLLPEWMREFQASSAITSVVGSTTAGIISGSGPVASYFIMKWGCGVTHMIGGATMALALICCSFTTSMSQIFILYSVVAGAGGGLCYVPSVITISEYFKHKRSIAVGVTASGIGFGSFIFPVVFEYLIHEYGWRGVMLIAGGINCNMIAFGLAMYPVEKAPPLEFPFCSSDTRSGSFDDKNPNNRLMDYNRNLKNDATKSHHPKRRNSFQLMRAWLRNPLVRRKSSLSEMSKIAENNRQDDEVFELKVDIPDCIPEEDEKLEESGLIKLSSKREEKKSYMRQLINLLKSGSFYILLFHNITMFFGMMIVFGLTPLRAVTDLSMTTQRGALLVSIMGFSNLSGRFLWGFVAAFKSVDTSVLFIILRLAAGVSTLISPLSSSFAASAIYSAIAGLTLGNWSIYPVVVAEQFGDQLLTVAFGYLEAANGIGCVLGPPIGGYLFDIFDTYQYSFIAGGSALVLGVAPLVITLCLKKGAKEQTDSS